jgi:hypothetical protein
MRLRRQPEAQPQNKSGDRNAKQIMLARQRGRRLLRLYQPVKIINSTTLVTVAITASDFVFSFEMPLKGASLSLPSALKV